MKQAVLQLRSALFLAHSLACRPRDANSAFWNARTSSTRSTALPRGASARRSSRSLCLPAVCLCLLTEISTQRLVGANPYDVRKQCDGPYDETLCYRETTFVRRAVFAYGTHPLPQTHRRVSFTPSRARRARRRPVCARYAPRAPSLPSPLTFPSGLRDLRLRC
jgi:hypothetical protein